MSLSNLKITFNLDGTGVYYDPFEPVHLDALIAWALMPFHRPKGSEPPTRDEKPVDIPLPLGRWSIGDQWGWSASALFPEGPEGVDLRYWRKKFRQNRIVLTKGSPNLMSGIYREYNTPMPLTLCLKMVGYAVGDRGRIEQILRKHVRFIGKKAAYGYGHIVSTNVEIIDQDYSLVKDGVAMRFLPKQDGIRLCRIRPPYWNNVDRVNCCEIGEEYRL